MTTRSQHLRARENGNAIVELALVTPLLLLFLLGAFDFGRVFYTAMAVTGAAHTGAQYGAQSTSTVTDTAGMTLAVTQASPGLGITASPSPQRVCRCETGAAIVSCTTTTSGCLPLRVYASVTAQATFSTIVNYPGIRRTRTISRNAQIRAQ